jgi:MFS family permease
MVRDSAASAPGEDGQTQAVQRRRLSTFHSLGYRDYRLLWLGQVGASASMWMEQVARPLLIFELTGSALMVGLVTATRMLPQLLVGLWAGVVADRADKRQILLTSQLVTLMTHFATAVLILGGLIEPWMVFATTFIAGSSMAFNQPARQSLIPRLVPTESLANAIALNSAAMNVMRIGGASAAGLILIFFDLGDLYLVQAFLYVWVITWTYQISVRTQAGRLRPRTTMLDDLGEGFSAVREDRAILYLLGLSLILFVWGFPYQSVFVPLIALEVLDIGRSGAGLLVSLTGVGALVGSPTVATVGDSARRRGALMLGQIIVYSIALLTFANAEIPPHRHTGPNRHRRDANVVHVGEQCLRPGANAAGASRADHEPL